MSTCKDCRYLKDEHFCHRYPPASHQVDGGYMSTWPEVSPYHDWCGEFSKAPASQKPDPNIVEIKRRDGKKISDTP